MSDRYSRQKVTPLLLIECGLAFLTLAFLIVVFAGNGLTIEDGYNEMVMKVTTKSGLWYQTTCTEDNDCSSKSLKVLYDEGKIHLFDYVWSVGLQIVVTVSFFLSGLICLLFLIILFSGINERKLRPLILCMCFSVGGFLLFSVCHRVITQAIDYKHKARKLHFPWTLLILALAVLVAFLLGTLNFIILKCRNREIRNPMVNKSKLMVIELIIMILSVILQLAVHGGDGILIREMKIDNSLTGDWTENNIFSNYTFDMSSILSNYTYDSTYVTSYRTILEKMGVWYATVCTRIEMEECTVLPLMQHLLDISSNSEYSQEFHKSRFAVATTLFVVTLLCTVVSMIIYGVVLVVKNGGSFRNFRIHVLTCTTVAGALGITFCLLYGLEMRDYTWENGQQMTFYFPWGLFLLGLSSILNALVAAINLCFLFRQQYEARYIEQSEMPLQNIH